MSEITPQDSDTFRLFSELPSFFGGFSSLFNFSSILDRYNTDQSEELADENSICSDWKAIGIDMDVALTKAHEERRRKESASI